jgi:hypothetical protein
MYLCWYKWYHNHQPKMFKLFSNFSLYCKYRATTNLLSLWIFHIFYNFIYIESYNIYNFFVFIPLSIITVKFIFWLKLASEQGMVVHTYNSTWDLKQEDCECKANLCNLLRLSQNEKSTTVFFFSSSFPC